MTEVSYSHLKCPRCTRLMKISKLESSVKIGRYVFYCYNSTHNRLKLVVLPDRFTLTVGKNGKQDYSLKELKCIFCRKSLWFDSKSSYNQGGKWTGRCGKDHVEIRFFGKLIVDEPTCEEIIQVIVRKSKW